MNEKEPIMINDVDVSECKYLYDDDNLCKLGKEDFVCGQFCKGDNCYYKQLKRKEEKCEELKKEIGLISCANIELSLEVKKYEKAINEIEEIADNNYENREMERIFNIIGGLDV